jgi:hypothetical protein
MRRSLIRGDARYPIIAQLLCDVWVPCLIAHTLKSTHIATALRLVVKVTTVSQLVDDLSGFTDAEQWLIVAFVTLMVVVFTCWVGFAVVLVTRTVLSAARFDTRKIRGLAGRAAMRLPAWRRSSPGARTSSATP